MTKILPFLLPALILSLAAVAGCDRQDAEKPSADQGMQTRAKRERETQSKPPQADPLLSAELNEDLRKAVSHGDLAERDKALAELAWRALGTDSSIAARAFEQISPGGPERQPLIDFYLTHLLEQQGVDQAIAWAGSLATPEEIAAAKLKVVALLAATDPEQAMNLLPRPNPNDPSLEGTRLEVLQCWSSESPAAAATWATNLPAGSFRESSIKAILSVWSQQNLPAALDWSSQLTNPSLREAATDAIIQNFSEQPEFIRQSWLDQMPGPLRESLEIQHQRLIQEQAEQLPGDAQPE